MEQFTGEFLTTRQYYAFQKEYRAEIAFAYQQGWQDGAGHLPFEMDPKLSGWKNGYSGVGSPEKKSGERDG